jgi:hypothetical protein
MWSEAIRFAVLAANRFFFNGLYFVQVTIEGSCSNGELSESRHGRGEDTVVQARILLSSNTSVL